MPNGDETSFKDEISRVAKRILENYFGDDQPIMMRGVARFLCSLAGSLTLLVAALASSRSDKTSNQSSFWELAFGPDFEDALAIEMSILLISSSVVSLMISLSVKKGGALRFFMAGFFLTAAMVSVAVSVGNV